MQTTTKKPSISVVIPAYNEEKYIGRCLEYIVKNSDNYIHEVIVVDNGSTDGTVQISTKFAKENSYIKTITEQTKGALHARQKGFHESRGEIIIFLDADNLVPPQWIQRISEEFSKDPHLVGLSGPYFYVDIPKYQQALVYMYWYIFAYPVYLVVGYMAMCGNLAMRRDILEKMNGFDTSITFYGDDTDMSRRASKYGKMKFMLSLKMYSSGRRLMGQGIFSTTKTYVLNYFSEVLLHRPVTHDYKDIR